MNSFLSSTQKTVLTEFIKKINIIKKELDNMKKVTLLLFAAVILVLSAGCKSTGSYISRKTNVKVGTYINEIAKKNMEYEGIERPPLIVIHGFQGSYLKDSKTGRIVWGKFKSSEVLFGQDDQYFIELSHPMQKGVKLEAMDDGIVPDGLLKSIEIKVLGLNVSAVAYNNLIKVLEDGGYQTEGKALAKGKHYNTLFEFSYDWRRDLPYNARKLDEFIKEKKEYLKQKYEKYYGVKDFDVQFDIIAHSMGGLLSRYYLRYGADNLPEDGSMPEITWAGSKHIDEIFICGTPNAGYLDTFLEMLKGTEVLNLTPSILGTFPTYYQMLPAPQTKSILYSGSNKPVDVFNPETWKKYKWGLLNPEEDKTLKILLPNTKTKKERFEIAYDHLSKCLRRAKQFIAAMEIKASPPDDIKLNLFAGFSIKTTRRAYINPITGKIDKIEYAPGDGKVTAFSALWNKHYEIKSGVFMDSPISWSNVIWLRAAHMGILEAPAFKDNILFYLLMFETKK